MVQCVHVQHVIALQWHRCWLLLLFRSISRLIFESCLSQLKAQIPQKEQLATALSHFGPSFLMSSANDPPASPSRRSGQQPPPSNEYVLNVAFFSFVGFMSVQIVFSLIAHSQAMLADSEAMAVDSLTYLFNLFAERIKNRPISDEEREMSPVVRAYRREIQRLYLELVPPSVSVFTLIAVTISTLKDACHTLRGLEQGDEDEDDVSIPIMLVFSAANLLLDVVNVVCFSRANVAFGLGVVRREGYSIRESVRESWRVPPRDDSAVPGDSVIQETTTLLAKNESSSVDPESAVATAVGRRERISSSDLTPSEPHDIVSLNMCSAWTVRTANTGKAPNRIE